MMETIQVNLGERSYSILVGSGILNDAGTLLKSQGIKGRIMVVTNPTVAQWYLEPLIDSLSQAGYDVVAVQVPDGETFKSLEEANRIYDALIEAKFDRKASLLALGGGVIGDLTGFVAATYLRGIGFIQVPTTLLAQVDSSIGGKVAVNHPRGKNLIGSFYQPNLVISDVETLRTLPQREFSSGMAEVIKHGVILDENYLQLILGETNNIRNLEPGIMTFIVTGSCNIKAQVVEEDEKELGLRAVLNFGHTLGHALESLTNYTQFKHGEAIAVGMLAATRLAAKAGILTEPELEPSLTRIFKDLGLPTTIPGLRSTAIIAAMQLDKKVESGRMRWVLPRRVGEVHNRQ